MNFIKLKNNKYVFLVYARKNLDITNKDIWLYLKENKWQNSYGLTLSDMTSDIINVDLKEILK